MGNVIVKLLLKWVIFLPNCFEHIVLSIGMYDVSTNLSYINESSLYPGSYLFLLVYYLSFSLLQPADNTLECCIDEMSLLAWCCQCSGFTTNSGELITLAVFKTPRQ